MNLLNNNFGGHANPKVPKDQTPCKYFSLGQCTRGAECEWMHNGMNMGGGFGNRGGGMHPSMGVRKPPGVFNPALSQGMGGRPAGGFNPQMTQQLVDQLGMNQQQYPVLQQGLADIFSSGLAQQLIGPPQMFGNPAPHHFSPMGPSYARGRGGKGGKGRGGPRPANLPPKEQVICKYYSQGRCDRGDACEWQHPGYKDGRPVPTKALDKYGEPLPPKNEVPCSFYAKPGGCKYGATCEWKHD